MKNASGLKDTNILRLPDGRHLGYAEYGDFDGKPVILFHGNPNSRLLYGLMPGCPFRPGLHLIAPDRPGYGLSDFYPPGRGVADYPDDIVPAHDPGAAEAIREATSMDVSAGPDN